MADVYVINGSTLTAIADSIRAKTGTTGLIPTTAMPTAIEGITGGGGSSSDERVKYVTFMNGDTELYKYPVIAGDTCKDPVTLGLIAKPTKDSTVQYDYTYSGWSLTDGGSANSSALTNVTEDRVVYAAFTATARKYTITYYDTDGTTVLYSEQVAYGTVPSYVPKKEGAAFGGWTTEVVAVTGDASYVVAQWVDTIASGTFSNGIAWTITGGGTLEISGIGAMPDYTYDTQDTVPYYAYADQITRVVIKDGITKVGNRTLTGMKLKNVVNVTIADSVTTLGEYTCYSMDSLQNVSIGKGVTSVRRNAFEYSDNLSAVDITDIDAWFNIAFYSGGSNPINGRDLYLNGELVTDVVVPENVTAINNFAFYGYKALRSITIPDSVTSIGMQVFIMCDNLTSATFRDPNGWYVSTDAAGTTNVVELSSTDLSDPATAATYLKSTHWTKYWHKS